MTAAPIAVTDGRVGIRSGAAPTRAMVMIGDYKTSGEVAYEGDRRRPGTGDAVLRCDFPGELPASGNAARALRLLLHHLATRTAYRTAILRVPAGEDGLLAAAAAAGFADGGIAAGDRVFTSAVPPVTYSDGVVTIRPLRADDIDRHMQAIDDDQIYWLWEPADRPLWEAMTPAQQREHNLRYLRASEDTFGAGPKWTFAADLARDSYVAYVDCDLANNHVPSGEANISYAGHPGYRGQGNVSRAVRLIARFLRDHTGAETAHIIVDPCNAPSLRVAHAVGAAETERWLDEYGRTMVRHVLPLR